MATTREQIVSDRTSEIGMIGAGLALALSWKLNGSILWAIFHLLLGWLYVAWYLVMNTKLLDRVLA